MAQKKQQAEDLRVRRTRKLLTQALIDLTIEKGFSAITVQDLVDRAMVNRATFYRHYLDKYDLLEKYMNEVYALTASQERVLIAPPHAPGADTAPIGLVRMFEHVQGHAAFYRAMLGAKGDMAFVHRILQLSEMRLREIVLDHGGTQHPPHGLLMSYLAQAGVGVMTWWLNEGQHYSAEQIAAWSKQLNQVLLEHVLLETKP